jgi:hypothetical protein
MGAPLTVARDRHAKIPAARLQSTSITEVRGSFGQCNQFTYAVGGSPRQVVGFQPGF